MEENRIPKRVLYMNLGTTRLRGRPRNRWQDKVREDGRIIGGEGWQELVHNREEWKKLLRPARNRRILHMPMEWMNEWMNIIVGQKWKVWDILISINDHFHNHQVQRENTYCSSPCQCSKWKTETERHWMSCDISASNVCHLHLNSYFPFIYSSGLSFRTLAAEEMNG